MLRYDEHLEGFQVEDLAAAHYVLQVEAEGYAPDERTVSVPSGDEREVFILGKEGMPHYYRGRVRVPFEPPRGLFGVSLDPARPHPPEEAAKHARKLGLEPAENIPPEVASDNVIVFRFRGRLSAGRQRSLVAQRVNHNDVI